MVGVAMDSRAMASADRLNRKVSATGCGRGLLDLLSRLGIHLDVQVLGIVGIEEKALHHLIMGLGAVFDRGFGIGVVRVESGVVEVGTALDLGALGEVLLA